MMKLIGDLKVIERVTAKSCRGVSLAEGPRPLRLVFLGHQQSNTKFVLIEDFWQSRKNKAELGMFLWSFVSESKSSLLASASNTKRSAHSLFPLRQAEADRVFYTLPLNHEGK